MTVCWSPRKKEKDNFNNTAHSLLGAYLRALEGRIYLTGAAQRCCLRQRINLLNNKTEYK